MTRKLPLLFAFILSRLIAVGQHPPAARHAPAILGNPDGCGTFISQTVYGGFANDLPSDIIATSDGGYLLIGYTNSFGNGGYDGYMVKLTNIGVIQWSNTYGGPNDDEFSTGIQTADGGFLLGGYTTSYGDPADAWLVKTDANGNMQWSKKYGDGNPYGERIFDLIQTADGGYAFCGDHKYIPGLVDAMVVRVDANGNLRWAQGFDSGGSDESAGLCEDRDSLVVSAFYQSATGYDAVLMKLEETAGNIAWLQSWDFDNRTNRLGIVFLRLDGYEVEGVNSDGYGVTNPWQDVLKTDFSGNLLNIQELHTTPETMNGAFSPTPDSGYIVENTDLPWNPDADIYFTKVLKDGNIDWSRSYPQRGEQQSGWIVPTADGGFAGLASTDNITFNGQGVGVNNHLLFIKTDSTGQTGACPSAAATASIRNPVVTNLLYNWASVYSIDFNPDLSITPVVASPVTDDSVLCQGFHLCLGLQLTGTDSICNMQNPVTYSSIRDSACISPIQWSVDSNYANIVAQTDSTVQLQYKQPGSVTLYGQIINSCGVAVQDSLPIRIIFTKPVDLGDDSSFCSGGSVVLNAGSGFQSYTWNNGDTTQQIVASATGIYSVQALNPNSHCFSTDTVAINVYPSPVINLGPDTTICRDSLYKFDAGSGFSSYLWQDGSSDSVLYTNLPGTYWVKVTDLYGCSASDTARILGVADNPQDFLQTTAEICSQGQLPLQLEAIGTWARYLWSNGTTGPTTTITTPGQYWLQVTSIAGCTVRDSIDVSGKACPIGIFFPNAFTPNNDGKNDVFGPIVYAALDKFYMAIYNRQGARVFETTDPTKGWDGTFNGKLQGTGTFVWYAQYQLERTGENVMEKGTVLLIR
jgi:gliding motility-associated-like protein